MSPLEPTVCTEPLLQVQNLTTAFATPRGTVRAVNGVSFVLHRGEILGIVGESGSGKSMTARSILRIIPPGGRITDGRVLLGPTDLVALSETKMSMVRGAQVAMIFQEPTAVLNPVLTVGEQIIEVLRTHQSMNRAEARKQALEQLREVGIPAPRERIRSYPHELSGGMNQRCTIAMAIACKPRVLIADEPTTALDVTVQAQILKLLVDITREKEIGLIFITHDIAAVAQIAQRVAVMYAGRLVEIGPTERIIDHPKHPYTQALLKALPTMTTAKGERVPDIPGNVPDMADLPSGCPFHPRCPDVLDRCGQQLPELDTIDQQHNVRCWLYE